ncbi:MAG TPA: CBS domain-containing protein [Anaerolineales bacterium]|nr:CBS domain-containing protein [Anaerolineales bacterium]
MGRLVREWMSKPAIFIDPEASVAHAMTLMRRRGIHSLVVSLDERSYGILTTTDIRDKIVAAERNPRQTRVKDIMSTPVLTANPEWDLHECSLRMQKANIHHLPVVNEKHDVIGLISATDIFAAVEEIGWEGQ